MHSRLVRYDRRHLLHVRNLLYTRSFPLPFSLSPIQSIGEANALTLRKVSESERSLALNILSKRVAKNEFRLGAIKTGNHSPPPLRPAQNVYDSY